MSYQKKNPYTGQYVQVAGLGADDPWAEAASGEIKPVGSGSSGSVSSEGGGLFDFLFGSSSPSTPKPAPKPSTTTQVGAGIGAFLKGLAAPPPGAGQPVMPIAPAGMSTTTKLALAGGGALVLVLLLTRD
jgi:hypothetical protein